MNMTKQIHRSFNQVRNELANVGLLDNGAYLDLIDLVPTSKLTSIFSGAHGFVFDTKVDFLAKLAGFKEGVIYITTNKKNMHLSKAYTLTDIIRHEYAHAWYWLDPEFVDGPWFKKAFGQEYASEPRAFGSAVWTIFSDYPDEFKRSGYANDYVSPYAMESSYEDFAETFRFYIRHRKSLGRHKSRSGVYKKLMAVHRAVNLKAKALAL
jgi:hypothetical protein